MKHPRLPGNVRALLLAALTSLPTLAADKPAAPGPVLENATLRMRLVPRTPAQISAFYEGRGFPATALAAVREPCFLTVGIRNRSRDVLWLELDHWRLTDAAGQPVPILKRAYWSGRWAALNLPRGKQSTFQWTLLPSQRDLQADESVGGNLVIQRTAGPLLLQARFRTGQARRGGEVIVRMEGVQCAD